MCEVSTTNPLVRESFFELEFVSAVALQEIADECDFEFGISDFSDRTLFERRLFIFKFIEQRCVFFLQSLNLRCREKIPIISGGAFEF